MRAEYKALKHERFARSWSQTLMGNFGAKKLLVFIVALGAATCYLLKSRYRHYPWTISDEQDLHAEQSQCETKQAMRQMLTSSPPDARMIRRLGRKMQQRICELQNPTDCAHSKKLLCGLRAKCGLGCKIHHIGICLFLAIGTNRTMIFDTDASARHQLLEAYLPLSGTCNRISREDLDQAVDIDNDNIIESTRDNRIVKRIITDEFAPFTAYVPYSIPDILRDALRNTSVEPNLWWIGQIMSYVTRLQSKVTKKVERLKRKLDLAHPIVGVHVRRADKNFKTTNHPLDDYMDHVTKWFDQYEAAGKKKAERKVFLSTEDATVFEEAVERYPGYHFLTSRVRVQNVGTTKPKDGESWRDLVEDAVLLSECDFLVCSFSSDIGRLAYFLMVANSANGQAQAVSVDVDLFQYAQPSRIREFPPV